MALPIIVPGLALVVDPISAAIISAPLLVFMDIFTVRAFGRANWSLIDLSRLIPGLLVGLVIVGLCSSSSTSESSSSPSRW